MLWLHLGCVEDDPKPEPEPEPLLTLYADADRDGFGDVSAPALAAAEGRGLVADATDCDDADAGVYPGATEACDEVDDDCDGLVDEDVQITVYLDADLDGWGDPDMPAQRCSATEGWALNRADCDDTNADIHPGVAEVCDEVDDDCDGVVDDGVEEVFHRDADGDGYGDPRAEDGACAASAGWVSNATDCDDGSATIHPGAAETTDDGIDQDCDGLDLADYAGTLYFASGFDRTPEVECERAYTTQLTPSSSICPGCEFAFDVAYTFDPSASYDAGGCLGAAGRRLPADARLRPRRERGVGLRRRVGVHAPLWLHQRRNAVLHARGIIGAYHSRNLPSKHRPLLLLPLLGVVRVRVLLLHRLVRVSSRVAVSGWGAAASRWERSLTGPGRNVALARDAPPRREARALTA